MARAALTGCIVTGPGLVTVPVGSGARSCATGDTARALGDDSIAIGSSAVAVGGGAIAIGAFADADVGGTCAIGSNSFCGALYSSARQGAETEIDGEDAYGNLPGLKSRGTMVPLSGTTPGLGNNETVTLSLTHGTNFTIGDNKSYYMEVRACARGLVGGIEQVHVFAHTFAVIKTAGVTSIIAVNAPFDGGTAGAAPWGLAVGPGGGGASPDIDINFSTGATTSQATCHAWVWLGVNDQN